MNNDCNSVCPVMRIIGLFAIVLLIFSVGQGEETGEQASGLSEQQYDINLQTVNVPMRDGVTLSTNLYIPKDSTQKFSVILMRTPYKKEMMDLDGRAFAVKGYVVAIQDVRGRFGSGGEWKPYLHEAEDGYDAIEWLAKQEWSNGKVGMVGGSYLAVSQLLAAKMKPPHLVTIIPNSLPTDPFYGSPYEYGSFFMTPSLWWISIIESNATADFTGKKIQEAEKIKYDERMKSLPVIDHDVNVLGQTVTYWREWITHNTSDSYWGSATYSDALKDIAIPVFLQSGWFDTQTNGTKLAYQNLSQSKNKNVRLMIGPWNHVNMVPRTRSTKGVSEEAKVNFVDEYIRWFDYWLKGINSNIIEEPPVKIYILNSGKWMTSSTYPLPKTQFSKIYLSSKGNANTLKGDGKLVWNMNEIISGNDTFSYDPGDPTPAPQYRFGNGRTSFDEITSTRQDILCYESNPLEEAKIIAGPISAKIFASSSARDTDWFVTLYAVTDKDEHIQMIRGTVRARFRNSMKKTELLEKNKIYEYTLDLWHYGVKLDKGWRIRVEIASAYFPQFSRNLNTGGNNEIDTNYVTANQKVFHTGKYASCIILPLLPEGN